jgi:tol-pal system protein YbgF
MNALFFRSIALSLILGIGINTTVLGEKPEGNMEQRLQRLERMLQNQSLADIVLQLRQLRQEVQQLRGDVEMQKHTMDAMSRRQRDLYLDIDQRLSRVQQQGGGAPITPPPGDVSAPSVKTTSPPPISSRPPARAEPGDTSAAAVPRPDPKKEEMAYQDAFNLLKQGRYPESITAFSNFLKNYSGGDYEDNAQYWLAEASYVNRDFNTALTEFTKVKDRYAQSPKVPGAMLKMGYIYYEKQDWSKTKEILRELQLNYPNTTEARLADKRLQRLKKEGR